MRFDKDLEEKDQAEKAYAQLKRRAPKKWAMYSVAGTKFPGAFKEAQKRFAQVKPGEVMAYHFKIWFKK